MSYWEEKSINLFNMWKAVGNNNKVYYVVKPVTRNLHLVTYSL